MVVMAFYMWKIISKIFGPARPSSGTIYVTRVGKSYPVDEVGRARVSGNLDRMVAVLSHKTHKTDRHFLLMNIVSLSYKDRKTKSMAELCARVAEIHISEFSAIEPDLRVDMGGMLPRVPTFQLYATLLSEQGNFDRAISVCQAAINFGLDDNSMGGYEGRIERIRKKKAKMDLTLNTVASFDGP